MFRATELLDKPWFNLDLILILIGANNLFHIKASCLAYLVFKRHKILSIIMNLTALTLSDEDFMMT